MCSKSKWLWEYDSCTPSAYWRSTAGDSSRPLSTLALSLFTFVFGSIFNVKKVKGEPLRLTIASRSPVTLWRALQLGGCQRHFPLEKQSPVLPGIGHSEHTNGSSDGQKTVFSWTWSRRVSLWKSKLWQSYWILQIPYKSLANSYKVSQKVHTVYFPFSSHSVQIRPLLWLA